MGLHGPISEPSRPATAAVGKPFLPAFVTLVPVCGNPAISSAVSIFLPPILLPTRGLTASRQFRRFEPKSNFLSFDTCLDSNEDERLKAERRRVHERRAGLNNQLPESRREPAAVDSWHSAPTILD
jgi:hypothetical protein